MFSRGSMLSAIGTWVQLWGLLGQQVAESVSLYGKNSDDNYSIVRIFAAREQDNDFSESSGHLRAILIGLNVGNALGHVVILGPGEGGWPMVVAMEDFTSDCIHSHLWWKNHERPGLAFHHPRVAVMTQDIGSVEPYRCDTLLCNMQPSSLTLELATLKVLEGWLNFRPKTFAIRVINYKDKNVVSRLQDLQKQLNSGRLIGIVGSEHGPIEAVYFVQGNPDYYSIKRDSKCIGSRIGAITSDLGSRKLRSIGRWPIPDELPNGVEQLAPLDMGATLEAYARDGRGLLPPKGGRNYLKELGWMRVGKNFQPRNDFYKSTMLSKLIEPLEPLIEDFYKWTLTYGDPETLDQTIREKIDHAPKENHTHHEYLWTTYKALAMYLRYRGCRVYRFNDTELTGGVNKQSSMGWQDRELECANMGEYLSKTGLWKSKVEDFKRNLLAGRPIKGDYNSSGKREPKKENRSRMVWSLCATGRLYEAQVLGSADELLQKIPYSINGARNQDYGEVFGRMLDHKEPRHAICDDIKGWDTKVSYSMLCMEAAFLQLLSDDNEHKNEIRHLYRLYAYAVVNVVEAYRDNKSNVQKFRKVFYQLQGQVASGRRVTYCMNTITNIVVTMSRAAFSQGIKLNRLAEWVRERLMRERHSNKYGGKISGDDTVIVLGKSEARWFADQGSGFMNDIGLIRKGTGSGRSQVASSIYDIEFCSRKYVHVSMYTGGCQKTTRLIPIRRTDEVLMKKLLREERRTVDYELAWAREQGRILLVEYFHVPAIRLIALALLSATPNNIVLDGESDLGWSITDRPLITKTKIIEEINQRYFGHGTSIKSDYRVQSLDDLGYISASDRKIFDLDYKSSRYKRWELTLYGRVCKLRYPNKPYDDWMEKRGYGIKERLFCCCIILFILLLKYVFQ